jgi:hypothetical protein
MPGPTTSIDTRLHIVAHYHTGDYSYRAIGRLLNIAPTIVSTAIHRYLTLEDNAPCHLAKIADEARQVYVIIPLVTSFMSLSLAVFKPTFLHGQRSLQT